MSIATASPDMLGPAAAGAGTHAPARVGAGFMAAYAFAQFTAWLALLTPIIITIPLKVQHLATPDTKAAYLAAVLAPGALAAMVAAPLWGTVCDRTTHRFGRRRLWIAIGFSALLAGLAVVAAASSLPMLVAGWLVCQIGSNAAQVALNAVMPDFVPRAQRGRMSGLLGLTIPLAYVSGTFLTQFTTGSDWAMFLVPAIPALAAAPLLLAVLPDRGAERPGKTSAGEILRGFWINPVRYPDFGWAFASRFLVMLAISFTTTYQVYFLSDRLGIAHERVAHSMFLSSLVTAGLTILMTPAAGWFSDRVRRVKPFVLGPALVIALGIVGIATSTGFGWFLVAVAVVGLGKGIYFAVDFALCVSVLPDPDGSAAKDLGIIQIANSLPQSLAPAIAPLFLAIGGGGNYPAVFTAATVAALCGAAAVLPIRGVR